MTLTLGKALTGDNDGALNLDDALITQGYDSAREALNRKKARSKRGPLGTNALNAGLKQALLNSLDIALDELLGRAWSGWNELRQYADPEQTPPEDINVVTVSNHTISSTHRPSVGVFVHGVEVHAFEFEVAANLDVQGINLQVQAGEITAIQLGKLKLGGSITLGDRSILEKEAADVDIPVVMRLKEPVPILRGGDPR